ncbi:DUF2461 domain-containing protein [Pedobacter sp.]|uniref:DUF2461 domain-containing protein n=1 Tax=Pedobacter sp. TaxID=1411316 RepID=UPI003D7F63C6
MISKSTLKFLADVSANNNREWFAEHKGEYEQAREEVLAMIKDLLPYVAKGDPLVSGDTDPKKHLMRIYRDVRFSKNKDPYKTNFGIWFSSNGKGGNEPGYYLHIQPGNSFFAAGYWMPDASHLKLIRQEIDYNSTEFIAVLQQKEFASNFALSKENTLKKSPKGYDPDDPNIELLKLKSFEVVKKIDDKFLLQKDIVKQLGGYIAILYPLVAFLRNAIAK